MQPRFVRFDLARVTIELQAPLTIGTGGGDELRDSVCVTDAGGLPAIPGTSIAGALRRALGGDEGPDGEAMRALFGFQEQNQGASSRLEVSWAQVHGQDDRPVAFRSLPSDDPVLAAVGAGVTRDHVRLNGAGVVDDRGKFDETLVPAGARFTFELRLDDPKEGEFDRVIEALVSLRLGGRTRRGFGTIKLVRVLRGSFDLCNEADRARYAGWPRALEVQVPRDVLSAPAAPQAAAVAPPDHVAHVLLELTPEDYWIFGGGTPVRDEHYCTERREGGRSERRKERDHVPVTETRITWTPDGKGSVEDKPSHLVPASSVKGALAHRTAFHYRRLTGAWLAARDESGGDGGCTVSPVAPEDARAPGRPAALEPLFGGAKGGVGGGSEEGTPGRFFPGDVYLPVGAPGQPQYGALSHVSLDRFTGGPVAGKLFSEAPLYGGGLRLEVAIDTRLPGGERWDPNLIRAFECAVDDLCHGRLALGAAANRGHGTFKGQATWTHKERWTGGKA